ncbi:MAG: HAD family hydrolase [Candidatus Levybacteria bacterium]|nr:HAD family hydrolase [Candidatus Levybacteria bacterium]
MKKKYKAIGFDLGDTLIEYENVPLNWKELYGNALEGAMKVCKLKENKKKLEKAKEILLKYNTRENPRTYEVTAEQIFSEILKTWNVFSEENLHGAIKKFFSFFQMKAKVFDDTIVTLQVLQQKGIPIGVFTDVPYGMSTSLVQKDVKQIQKYITILLSSVDVGYRKPEQKVFNTLASRLAVSKKYMIYVGNEEKDIVGAKNAGMFAVLLDRNDTGKSFGEDKRIATLQELLPLFS